MKKRIFCIFGLMMAATLCLALFAGCNGGKDAENDSDVSGTDKETSSEEATKPIQDDTTVTEPDDTKFNIFFNKDYLCAFVWPEDITSTEAEVGQELKRSLAGYTGKIVTFVKESEVSDDYKYVVLLGNTSYQESKDAYATLGKREAVAKVVGNKLVIAFDNLSSGKGIVKALLAELEKCPTREVNLSLNYSDEYKALPTIDYLPAYVSDSANEVDCGRDTSLTQVSGASVDDFDQYCLTLEAAEFEKISSREEQGNLFATFVGEDGYAYVYYTKYNSEIRVVTGPIEALAEEDYTSGLSLIGTPYIASIPQPNDGLGLIFGLPDGRFIILDGGYKDNDRVYKTLKELQPSGEIVIAAWFISHPHGDHFRGLTDFVKNHGSDKSIKIERVIHNYVDYERYNINGSAGLDESGKNVLELYETMEKYAPDVPILKAHTGQVMDFGDAAIEVLYTVEDLMPKNITNINDSSMVIRLNMGGHRIMLLADTCYASGPILNKLWGDYLRSDIMQIAHHGVWPSVVDIYNSIQAQTIIFPAMYKNLKNYIYNSSSYQSVVLAALDYAKDIYVTDAKTFVIELPYTIQNNKEEMLEYIKNYQ